VLAFFILIVGVLITFYRWQLLLKGQNIFLSTKDVISLGFIGLFFTSILPGAVGGDLVKSVYIAKKVKSNKTSSVLTVLLDRVIGVTALVMICTLGLLLNFETVLKHAELRTLSLIIVAILVALMLMTYIGLSRKIRKNKLFNSLINKLPFSGMFNKVYDAFHAYRDKHKYLTYALLLSFFNHALNITAFYLITKALGFSELGIYTYFFIVPMGLITTAIPITPAGIGVGQAAFLKLFEWTMNVKTTIGADAITIWQALSIIIFMFGGIFYLTYKKDLSKKDEFC
jgi:glycosyltransferase 2 family protein